MRLGLIARADSSGLGTQTWEMYRHLQPSKTLVIDVGHLHNTTTHCNKATYLDRYPDAMICHGWELGGHQLVEFLRDLDVVVTCETPYGPELIPQARRMGVRSVICPNYEFLDRSHQPDLWAVPSPWHWDQIPEPKIFLPVPIALDRVRENRTSLKRQGDAARCQNKGPHNFLHIVGRPAIHDRNGTPDVLAALRHVKSDIRLILRCQDVNYLQQLRIHDHVPTNVQVVIDSTDVRDYWDNYTVGDVMILPRRYGGLCLPANEALGAGMPVIMTDISPNNQWLPREWLVPAAKTAAFMAFNHVDVHMADPVALAAKIDQFASDDDFYSAAKSRADDLAHAYSWNQMLPLYERVLRGDVTGVDQMTKSASGTI